MIHPSHQREIRQALLPIVAGVLLLGLLWFSPAPASVKGLANYLPLHMVLETASIFFAGMIFAVTWHTPRKQTSINTLIVGCVFAGVALLDFTHMLSYSGMPSFVTPSDSNKAIYFWLAARVMASLGLLIATLGQWHRLATRSEARLILSLVLCAVVAVHAMVLFNMEALPPAFISGQGLTAWKVHAEYVLVALYLLPVFLLWPNLNLPRTENLSGFMAACVLMAMSEFSLTLYADVTDLYNFSGHIFKIAAYFYLYRPLFIELLQAPYEHLEEALAEQQATLHALPDLLFELDEDGRFHSVHTGRAHLLLMSPEEFIGKTMNEVLPPDIAQVGMQAIAEARTAGTSSGKQYAMDLPQGRFHFELSVAAKFPVGAPNNRYVFIARNVTERVENEENLKKEAQRNAALIQLSQHDESTSLQARAQRALSSMVTLTGSTLGYMASISPLDHQGHTIGLYANGQAVEQNADAPWSLRDDDVWGKAIREHRPVVLPSTGDIPVAHGLPETLGAISNWIALPVFDGNHLVMLAGIGNKAHAYTEADVEFLHLMAYNFWQITHKLETDFALRRFSMATEQSPNPVIITDPKGRIEYVNAAFTRVTGYRADEAIGRNPRMLKSGKTEATLYKSMWSQLLSGQAWSGELINRRKNGQEYYEDALIYPIRNHMGVVTHYLAHKQDITERKSTAERIQYLSEFDQLTGLPNRALLIEQLQFEVEQAQRTAQSLMVLWLNLDLFKDINDTYGHEAGDGVLREVARRLRTLTKGRDLVSRYSGDNFIIVRENTDQFGASRLAVQLFETLSAPHHAAA